MRGNLARAAASLLRKRSIPACAGEPKRPSRAPSRYTVYPRVCGGTDAPRGFAPDEAGLSPRVRGNPGRALWLLWAARSIPACAGEPYDTVGCRGERQVYPRVCGGTWRDHPDLQAEAGLSPRVRGNLALRKEDGGYTGSIPACAGEPLRTGYLRPLSRVYPRVCGGTMSYAAFWSSLNGLSPRVRGNRCNAFPVSPRFRSIPACAGEPFFD